MNVGLIPPPDNEEKIYHNNGSTEDIIQIVLKGCNADIKKGFKQFCQGFSKDESGLRDLWSFIKYRIVYQVDDDGRQDILLPAALWHRGWGDCKSKTVFTIHVLRCLGIPYKVRFTGYSGKSLTHVYALAYLNGEEYIIDTVFDFFNREKSYKNKKDFDMTKISMISGFQRQKDIDYNKKAKLYVEELQQKKAYIPPQENIDLTGTVGAARAELLKRQLVLLRTFNMDKKDKVADYTKAIQAVDKAILYGPDYKISGTAYSDIEAQVKNIINTKLKDFRPAMDYRRTQPKIGAVNDTVAYLRNLIKPNSGCPNPPMWVYGAPYDKTCYRLGAETPYRQGIEKVYDAVVKFFEQNTDYETLLQQYLSQMTAADNTFNLMRKSAKMQGKILPKDGIINGDNFTFGNTTIKISELKVFKPAFGIGESILGPTPDISFEYFHAPSGAVISNGVLKQQIDVAKSSAGAKSNWMRSMFFDLRYSGVAAINQGSYFRFTNPNDKSLFEKYIEEQSGVWQKYLNETIFKEKDGAGVGAMYHYLDGVKKDIPLNKFGSVINSKKAVQSQWMTGMNYLTGADQTIINDLGRNTFIANAGENPEDALLKMASESGLRPNVGEIVTIIVAIGGIITALTPIILAMMSNGKRDADQLSPEKAVSVPPIGQPLMFDESDWQETDNNATEESSSNGLGMNTSTLLALGLLGVGGYFLMKKK